MTQPAGSVTRLEFSPGVPGPYRMVIRDETLGEIIIKDVIEATHYVVDWSVLDPSHAHRWRVQTRGPEGWCNTMGYRHLRQEVPDGGVAVVQTRPGAVASATAPASRGWFMFTIDTEVDIRRQRDPTPEAAVENQIFGRIGEQSVGIPLIMDLLEACSMKGVFFVDVFMEHLLGRSALERTIEAIVTRGHDVQLHLHTRPHLAASEDATVRALENALYVDEPDVFRRALELGVRLFEDRVGRPPIAYRAGSYMIREFAFPILAEYGIRIDSSIWPFKHCKVGSHLALRTQPSMIDGVLELPITWLLHDGPRVIRSRQLSATPPVDIAAGPMVQRMMRTGALGAPWLSALIHSHTFLDHHQLDESDPSWPQWQEHFRSVTPTRMHELVKSKSSGFRQVFYEGVAEHRIDAIRSLLAGVQAEPGMQCITCRDLVESHWSEFTRSAIGPQVVPVWRARGGVGAAELAYAQRFGLEALEASEREVKGREARERKASEAVT